ncbi:hypothetical protein JCM21531_761 [Acetivibrio straminisolvens JCM 21531]|uniref:Uncharacterized protein n=1 Tax=Acetivibrio straminisolvens JCM 21531 TaxID=1294263 RepID=W4V2N2_9FIRM|nr:hypothetical protein JCM21531_761 [Acetivibrio straminisolvens JCM 21531]
MTHSLSSYLGPGNFNSTPVTHYTFISDSLVFSAMTFPVFLRSEYSLTKQTVSFGL